MHRTPLSRPRSIARWAPVSLATIVALSWLQPDAVGAPQGAPAAGSFAKARSNVAVRNFADLSGNELTRLKAGHPVRVYGTSEGTPRFHEVEVAGGVPVWVFGELLQPTNTEGVLRVDAAHVNMRPLPESSPRSMALRAKLQAGTRVHLVERQDPSKPLAQDWVKVWAPESARVWIATGDLDLVPGTDSVAQADIQAAWIEAGRRVPTVREAARAKEKVEGQEQKRQEAALPPIPTVPQEAIRALTEADIQFDRALALPEATAEDWNAAHELYSRAHSLAPEGTATHTRALERLRTVEGRRELASMRATIRAEDDRRQSELAEIVAEREKQGLRETVHWGRFQGRGWLESRNVGGERRWYIVWGGETVAEVRCSSQRYNLAIFEGFELGVTGTTVSPAAAATARTEALPRILDIMRIEVLSGTPARR